MKTDDIIFDENLHFFGVKIPEQLGTFVLALSDDLLASEEELSDSYKEKIINFLQKSVQWYKIALDRIFFETNDLKDIVLITVYILFEQTDDIFTFGLEYSLDYDREHGRGIQINGETLEIVQYGEAHVAFC